MSQRELNLDYKAYRASQYSALQPKEKEQEALWEALQAIQEQGIDVGPKASEILENRQKIRKSVPKP